MFVKPNNPSNYLENFTKQKRIKFSASKYTESFLKFEKLLLNLKKFRFIDSKLHTD